MWGKLVGLYPARLARKPSDPQSRIPGRIGVFEYGGDKSEGTICLFAPDDPVLLDGRVKLRLGPGMTFIEGKHLLFIGREDDGSCEWEPTGGVIDDPGAIREFLAFAEANDDVIRRLLDDG